MKFLSQSVTRFRSKTVGLTLAAGMILLAACQPVAPAAPIATTEATTPSSTIPEVVIEINDTDFTIPTDFPGGIVAVTVQNNTDKDLDVNLNRVREGATAEELVALNADYVNNFGPIMEKASSLYSFVPVPAGASSKVTIDFRTGDFVIDATEHYEDEPIPGAPVIIDTFSATEIVGTTEPHADVTVEFADFALIMPDSVTAGQQVWHYKNTGKQWHMVFGARPLGDLTIQELLSMIQAEEELDGPPPFEFMLDLGVPPMGEGEQIWLQHNIEAGEYVMACPLPDMAATDPNAMPASHIHHGMYRILTVTE